MPSKNSHYIEKWIDEIHVNECAVISHAQEFNRKLSKPWKTLESVLLLKALTLVDLTTLGGDDTFSNVTALVNKGLRPLPVDLVKKILDSAVELLQKIHGATVTTRCSLNVQFEKTEDRTYLLKVNGNASLEDGTLGDFSPEELIELKQLLKLLHLRNDDLSKTLETFLSLKNDSSKKEPKKNVRVAAVCVYPKWVKTVQDFLEARGLSSSPDPNLKTETKTDTFPIAAVAAGFPSGQYDLESKTREIVFAVRSGASEIDIVISRCLVIGHKWRELFKEIRCLKQACGDAKMKTILAVGECGSLENVYKASMVAMMAGSDYIKTSTGKEAINATLPVGVVMCRAIRNYYIKTGKKVGFKPAGGIRTADDALKWMKLVITELGADWLSYFRIGASGVIDNIGQRLKQLNS